MNELIIGPRGVRQHDVVRFAGLSGEVVGWRRESHLGAERVVAVLLSADGCEPTWHHVGVREPVTVLFDGPVPVAEIGAVFAGTREFFENWPRRQWSPECDYGVWWQDERGGNWRISYVEATTEIYALSLGPTRVDVLDLGRRVVSVSADDVRDGPLVVIGRVQCDDEVEDRLAGWAEICGTAGSLRWAIERLSAVPAET